MQTHWLNPLSYFDQVYYINLDNRVDRNIEFVEEIKEVDLGFALRVSGIIHENPATGCHLSHAKIFDDAIESGYDRILIFEDDVEFFPDAYTNLEKSLNELPSDWDMFYLGANLDAYPAYEISEHIAKLVGAYSTHAYAIRRNLFQTLFDINSDTSIKHNDVYYSQNIHPNYNCYLAMPLIAGQRESYSDIQKQVMKSNDIFQSRLKSNLVRKDGSRTG